MRLFAAILPPDGIIRDLTRLQKGVSGARWVSPEKLHITLGFFGDVDADRADILDIELARVRLAGFDISLAGLDHFGSAKPRSLWAGVAPSDNLDALHRLCRRAARAADIQMEARDFRPHVTLAYLKSDADHGRIIAFERNHNRFKTPPFLVDSFVLMSSHAKKTGPNIYRIEASYPLLGA